MATVPIVLDSAVPEVLEPKQTRQGSGPMINKLDDKAPTLVIPAPGGETLTILSQEYGTGWWRRKVRRKGV